MIRLLFVLFALALCGCPYRPVDESEREVVWSADRGSRTYAVTEVSCGGGCAKAWLCSLDVRTKERGLIYRLPLASDDGRMANRISARLDETKEIVWIRFGKEEERPIVIPSDVLAIPLSPTENQKK